MPALLAQALALLDRAHRVESTASFYHWDKLIGRLQLAENLRMESRALASIHHAQANAMRRAA